MKLPEEVLLLYSRTEQLDGASSLWGSAEMNWTNFTHGSGSWNESLIQRSVFLPSLMFAGGAVGNLIAIIALSVSRQERKSSAFYTLVCGLAVTDLLGTCLASPLTIASYLDRDLLRDQHVCAFLSFLLLFFGVAGLSIICAMAAERYLAVCCPYTYRRWSVDRRFAQKFLFLVYAGHVLFCCLPVMGAASSAPQPPGTWCFIDWRSDYSVLYGAVSLLLILGTIALNVAVCGALLLMRQRVVQLPAARGSVRQRWSALSSAAETQMIAVLVTTSVVVLACSAPLVVRVFANRFLSVDYGADLAAIRIASVNPILDPWIYILLRRSLFRRFLCVSRRPRQQAGEGHVFTRTTGDSHVFAQLMCSANAITQIPAVKFSSQDSEDVRQT